MKYILDVQGFIISQNTFIAKEISIVQVKVDATPVVLDFQPPLDLEVLNKKHQNCNEWLSRTFHGIPWESGTIPYKQLQSKLQEILKDAKIIYVKGLQKKTWLKTYFSKKPIRDMDDLGCPSVRTLIKDFSVSCWNHSKPDSMCAKKNVVVLRIWLLGYFTKHRFVDCYYFPARFQQDYDNDGIDEVDC